MLIYIGEISEKYYYGVYNIIKMLYPDGEIIREKEKNGKKAELNFEFEIYADFVKVWQNGRTIEKNITADDISLTLKLCIYKFSKKKLPFGVFTGIRPAKIIMRSGNKDAFTKLFLADQKKAEVASKCAFYEKKLTENIKKGEIALYIHIPFCPTRCSYCSFTAVNCTDKLLSDYFEALYLETKAVLQALTENCYSLRCVYVGGGTPTILSAVKLSKLLSLVRLYYPDVKEFTVEAGRPDSITEEKLDALKANGVTRISVNPQSLNDKTLEAIGRKHTADDFLRAYHLAEKKNFSAINTDLIAGLKGEKISDFKYTLENILRLTPKNITVHTLCKKRCAVKRETSDNLQASAMLDYAYEAMKDAYTPYYIYRQKNAVGSLENTGFMRDGQVCEYNIIMMEEIASVIAVGAGSASRLVDFETKKPFSKLRSDKQPQRYIADIENIINEKRRFLKYGYDRC